MSKESKPRAQWENHFATLDADQRNDPLSVIELFCDNDTPFETRRRFFDLFAAAMGNCDLHESDDPFATANWMWFFRISLQLMEAAFVIDNMRSEGRLTYSIKNDNE
jgi:hypothetical protein